MYFFAIATFAKQNSASCNGHAAQGTAHFASVSDEVMDPVIFVIFDDIYTYNTRFISHVTLTELSGRHSFIVPSDVVFRRAVQPVDLTCLGRSSIYQFHCQVFLPTKIH